MSRAETIYPLQRFIKRELAKVENDPFNKEILMRYYKVRSTDLRLATLVIDFIRLNVMSRLLEKKFENATVEDIENLIFAVNQKYKHPNTQNKFRKVLRYFFRWMKGCAKNEFPAEVKWITMNKIPLVSVKSEDLISYEECVRITECATNIRDKALFQCKLDAGCRIGEILTVKVGEVKFNNAGAILYSEGKTGYQPIILTWSAKNLALWINSHPFRNDENAPLWVELNKARPVQLSYAAARAAFQKCVDKAGCKKRVWLHLLKHVSSTEDYSNGMPESFRRYKHHWTPSSRMPEVYEHLTQSMIPKIQQESWNRMAGPDAASLVQPEEQKESLELIKVCKRCEFQNPRDLKFCGKCGFDLDQKHAMDAAVTRAKLDELLNKLAEDPEKLEKLLSLVAI